MKNMFSNTRKNEPSQESTAETVKSTLGSRSKARFNLQVKLPVAGIVILILAFVGLTALSVSVSKTTLTKTLQSSLQSEASLQAENIRSHLTWTRSMAVDLGSVAESMDLDEETSQQVIAQMLSQNEQVVGSTIAYEPYQFKPDVRYWAPYYNRASDGSLQFTQLGTPENNYPSQDWYKLAKEANGIILSPPYFDAGGAKIWMVTWSVPFHDASGKLKGVATTDIAFSQTQGIVRQIAVGKRGYAFLIDKNGVILGIGDQGGQYSIMEDHLVASGPSEREASWNSVIEQMIGGQSGFAHVIDPQGNAMFLAYQPIGMDTGWSLGLAYPQEELFQPAIQLQNNLFLLSAVVLVLASIILLIFTRFITRPLQEITAWARLISQRQKNPAAYQTASPLNIHTNDEIEELAETFNQMSQELAQAFSTLERHVQIRTQALSWVAEVGTAASTILDTDKLLQQVVDVTKERFGFYHTHIYLLNETGDTLLLASGAGEVGRQMVAKGHSIPLDREHSLVARVAREKKGITVNDVTQTPDFLPNPLLPETRSEMAVPMLMGEQVIGVFDVQSATAGRFTDTDIAVQTTLAAQVAAAVHNARSYTRVSEAEQLTHTIIDATPDAIYIKDRNHRYRMVNEVFANSIQRPASEIIGKDDIELGFPEELVKGNPEKGIRGYWTQDDLVFETGEKHSFSRDDFISGGEKRLLDTVKLPLRNAEGEIWAVLAFTRDVTESEFLHNLTAQRARQQETLNLVSQKIQSTITIEEALQVAAREVGHALGGRETIVAFEPSVLAGDEDEQVVSEKSRSTL